MSARPTTGITLATGVVLAPGLTESSVLDSLPIGVLIVSADGVVRSLNRTGHHLLGIGGAIAAGAHIARVLPLADWQGCSVWAAHLGPGGYGPGSGTVPEREGVLTFGPAAGMRLWFSVSQVQDGPAGPGDELFGPAGDSGDGSAAWALVCFRPVTDPVDRAASTLVEIASHELRNLLSPLMGFSATLLTRWPRLRDDQKLQMVALMNASASSAARLAEELLTVARIDLGHLQIHRTPVDLAAVAERVVALRVAGGDEPARFVVRAAAGLPATWLDGPKVEQVVANLVDNAVRHGAGKVTVSVTATGQDGAVTAELLVSDEGPGIPRRHREVAFGKYWHGGHGTGLGLYLVRGIVAAHGGTITIGTATGGGASLRVVMPSRAPDLSAHAELDSEVLVPEPRRP